MGFQNVGLQIETFCCTQKVCQPEVCYKCWFDFKLTFPSEFLQIKLLSKKLKKLTILKVPGTRSNEIQVPSTYNCQQYVKEPNWKNSFQIFPTVKITLLKWKMRHLNGTQVYRKWWQVSTSEQWKRVSGWFQNRVHSSIKRCYLHVYYIKKSIVFMATAHITPWILNLVFHSPFSML